MAKEKNISDFISGQLSRWPLCCANYRALKNVSVKTLTVNGLQVRVQFNPARAISSAAKLDKASIAARPCFLCRDNRPAEQSRIRFEGRKGKKYDILVNPYPIFPEHLVIALASHSPQSIWKRYVDMLDLAGAYQDFLFFYNGPSCGASAPDHHHFQASRRGTMPLECDVDACLDALCEDSAPSGEPSLCGDSAAQSPLEYVSSVQDADLYRYNRFTSGIFVLRARTAKSAAKMFYRLLDCAPVPEGDSEPRFNLLSWHSGGEFRSVVIFRKCHRSHHYFSDGPDHLVMSPGCADMGGVFITVRREDFDKLDSALLSQMLEEVSCPKEDEKMIVRRLTRTQPQIEVGIMTAPEIEFEILSDGAGSRKAVLQEGKIQYDGALYDELYFGEDTLSTMFAEASFVLHDVVIGKGFHWQQKESQSFAGALKIVAGKDALTAINVVGVEDYLVSVISSEMKSTSSLEFLKAHAVISRSWVMSQILSRAGRRGKCRETLSCNLPQLVTELDGMLSGRPESGAGRYVRWYDHADHKDFDVCADDHCQRYQGLTRAVGETVRKAVDSTWGQVLTFDGGICDARFSKCCGGVTEKFSVCWDDRDYDYLKALPDTPSHKESEKAFCDTSDPEILSQVLNSYDRTTADFYSWEREYSKEEISSLISSGSGTDIGELVSLKPLERGASGRIYLLEVVGTKNSFIVGKELEIRRILSESHLKSSAFEVFYRNPDGELVRETARCGVSGSGADDSQRTASWTSLVLKGKGWGHGVGLCQIGAAVMASRGYTFGEILEHYYPGTVVGPVPEPSADSVPDSAAGPVPDSADSPVLESADNPVPELADSPVPDSAAGPVPDSPGGNEGGNL